MVDASFSEYDGQLIDVVLAGVMKEQRESSGDFYPGAPGAVTIRFNLDDTGRVSEPQVMGHTLTEPLGQFFLNALQHGAPYGPWPDAVRSGYGAATRPVKMTFRYD
ncbi:MAG TPA: hypothetical protein VL361_29900 [Candidatus Limnocylindrales bacterium]|nr:hypothetical protein [Candidatus Limnocylindrales bacterium]